MDRAIEQSLRSLEEDQAHDYDYAVGESKSGATADLIEDAIVELTGLHGNPWARMRLLAVLGLDDLQAHTATDTEEGEDLKERLKVIKNYIENFVYSTINPLRDPAYEDAMHYIENAEASDLPVYNTVLPIHLDMCGAEAEEERRRKEEEEERERAEEERRRAEEVERLKAEEEKKRLQVVQKEETRQARLRYYMNK
jgi:hypothetical protein